MTNEKDTAHTYINNKNLFDEEIDEELLEDVLDSLFEPTKSKKVIAQVQTEFSSDYISTIDELYNSDETILYCTKCKKINCLHINQCESVFSSINNITCNHKDRDEFLEVCMACIVAETKKNKELFEQQENYLQLIDTDEIADFYSFVRAVNIEYGFYN